MKAVYIFSHKSARVGAKRLMKYVGKIDDIIFNGKFIVRTTFKPRTREPVVDKHKKPIGRIYQIIGPVKTPYITITPAKNIKPSFNMIGTSVYLL